MPGRDGARAFQAGERHVQRQGGQKIREEEEFRVIDKIVGGGDWIGGRGHTREGFEGLLLALHQQALLTQYKLIITKIQIITISTITLIIIVTNTYCGLPVCQALSQILYM